MNKEQMLSKIYEVIATNKQEYYKPCPRCGQDVHSEYCNHGGRPETAYQRYVCNRCGELTFEEDEALVDGQYEVREKPNPVMIGDVLQHFQKEIWYGEEDSGAMFEKADEWLDFNEFFGLRENKRKPIDDQSDECIKFVYDLLPTK